MSGVAWVSGLIGSVALNCLLLNLTDAGFAQSVVFSAGYWATLAAVKF